MATSTFVKIGLIVIIILLAGILAAMTGFLTAPLGFLTIPEFCTIGSENVISETRTVDTFHSADLRGWGNLYVTQNGVTQDGKFEIRIEAEDNILPLLETHVTDGMLVIEQEEFRCIRARKPVNVYVTMDEVKKLSEMVRQEMEGATHARSAERLARHAEVERIRTEITTLTERIAAMRESILPRSEHVLSELTEHYQRGAVGILEILEAHGPGIDTRSHAVDPIQGCAETIGPQDRRLLVSLCFQNFGLPLSFRS